MATGKRSQRSIAPHAPARFQLFSEPKLPFLSRDSASIHTRQNQDRIMADDQRPTASKSSTDSGSDMSAPRQQQEALHHSQAQSPLHQTFQTPTSQNATSLDRLQVLDVPMGVPLREIGLANPRGDFPARRRQHEMEMHPDLLFDELSWEKAKAVAPGSKGR